MNDCKCGGEAIIEDGYIPKLNSMGKFVCCMECPKETKVYPEHEIEKAIQNWNAMNTI